ncbi:hypothetical protein IVB18_41320 [Bradyrhizobium sp. 186]|uniref:hypothetical protein n=1 Tax=Bradyrhizobium sp. 186 TaxID=2782654 RepID=UPI002000690B|nr:hypothetical protein [Bradyrhizobium sp. 186]UPK34474.1 hypothetical protein IVB18_41320 [Bradyrhizobium sp. 186]
MRHHRPFTYIRFYRAPTFTHWLKIKAALISARLFGYWDYPRADAAAAFEEWTLTDLAYSLYKNARPIIRAEKRVSKVLFLRDKSVVKLPDEFRKNTSVTIGAAGDLMPAEGLEFSKDIFFENIADVLLEVDISFANLEGPVTEQNVEVAIVEGSKAPILGFSIAQFPTVAGHRGKYFTALSITVAVLL